MSGTDSTRWEQLYDAYTAAASCADTDKRLTMLRECATDDVTIISPFPYEVAGIEAVSAQLGAVAASQPDGVLQLRRTSAVDAHHQYFRASFENCDSRGTRLSTGMHVIEVRDDRIARILVFVPDLVTPLVP
jgi:hypothetical protein